MLLHKIKSLRVYGNKNGIKSSLLSLNGNRFKVPSQFPNILVKKYSIQASGTRKISSNVRKTKKASSKLQLQSSNSDDIPLSIEEIYQKKSPIEHIILRPDSYVGSVERVRQEQWVFCPKKNKVIQKECVYVPALYKIFDEILVNASDHKYRDPTMSEIHVSFDVKKNIIKIRNNGKGIPIQIHKEEGIYLPELLLGNLLTGSNFNDNISKITGGRNGYGAKLANIFSTSFSVETVDESVGLKYSQVWTNNMSEKTEPIITPISPGEKGYTEITFSPDLKLFKMRSLNDTNILEIMTRRVHDISAIHSDVNVYLNGKQLPSTFKEYSGDDLIQYKSNDGRWNVYAGLSNKGQFVQLSFVNGIHTLHGGSHVNYITDQIVKYISDRLKRNNKSASISAGTIKNHLTLVINCMIENPAFDSQTKERLTLKQESFGSTCNLSEKFLKDFVSKTNILNIINSSIRNQQKLSLARNVQVKNKSKIFGITKLDDANEAGGPKSLECTLIITEGDSAKSLAVSGLSVIGRDYYGVFPIQGKLLNVRDAPTKKVAENQEIKDLIRIIGLNPYKTYKDWEKDSRTLRYGKIMLMADQDHDGSHIKGLFINFLHHFWPELVKRENFLYEFITPIIKATYNKQVKSFFTIAEYEEWKKSINPNDLSKWKIKYYKGLGTSTSLEAKEYFSNLKKHVVEFKWDKSAESLIDMAFNRKLSNLRREWLLSYNRDDYVDTTKGFLSINDFINKELISFSYNDNVRSIPSVIDGLKPSQRKVLYSSFKRNLTNEIKVAQLAGYVSEQSGYHHGELSLHGTIINMAQNYVGSNNIPLLYPSGQFGTRLQGGKDAASARYIYTRLNSIARLIFHPYDDHLLQYLDDDGYPIEPVYYIPVIPMLLVNGSEGVGTGWSTSIPAFNPLDIIDNILLKMEGKEMKDMKPFYFGFEGEIIEVEESRYLSRGVIVEKKGHLHITELPIGRWTNDYKVFLESLIKDHGIVKSYTEHHTEESVHFHIIPASSETAKLDDEQLYKIFKLEDYILTSNMCAFDANGVLKKYKSPLEIINEFYDVRIMFYEKRKSWIVNKFENELKILRNKVQFIKLFMNGDLKIFNEKRDSIESQLKAKNFDKLNDSYDYLMNMSILSLTLDRMNELEKEISNKTVTLNEIKEKTAETLWRNDLEVLRNEIIKIMNASKKKVSTSNNQKKKKIN